MQPAFVPIGYLRTGALMLVMLALSAGGARAELLETHPHRDGVVHLMSDLCREEDPFAGQDARQTVGGRERQGCWGVDGSGNPVVTWSDGSELMLDAAQARTPFARPAWCPDARFPHELLVCSDAELAERDLRLASLWWPYRRSLSRAAEAWHKSDYFRRLKACGANRSCIAREQDEQMRRYRDGVPSARR